MEVDPVVEALDEALDAVLRARLEAGPVPVRSAPVMALAAGLARNGDYLAAKQRSAALVQELLAVVGPRHWGLVLDVEAALRDEAAHVVDVAFAVGLTATGGR